MSRSSRATPTGPSRLPTPPEGTGTDAASERERRRAVLTKAVLRVAELLEISQRDLAPILGVSEATVSRMKDGGHLLDGKPFELAALLVRVHRSLDAVVGGQMVHARAWFRAENRHLEGVPANLVGRVEGLVRVAEYLDAMRGAQ